MVADRDGYGPGHQPMNGDFPESPPLPAGAAERIYELLSDDPSMTPGNLADQLKAEGYPVQQSSVAAYLRQLAGG